MAVVTLPDFEQDHYRPTRTKIAFLLLVFFGLILLAAVREIKVECRSEKDCLGVAPGSCMGVGPGAVALAGTETRQCEVVMGDIRILLPAWALRFVA